MEVVRDKADNCIIVCAIENFDAMGVHTGDSITVAPAQTLTDKEYQIMRNASLAVLREIGVETGGSNVQFGINPENGRMVVTKIPRFTFEKFPQVDAGLSVDDVFRSTHVDPWYLVQIEDLIREEHALKSAGKADIDQATLFRLKRKGFSDARLARLLGTSEVSLRKRRHDLDIRPVYKRVDTCAAEFASDTAYMYSTYEQECEADASAREKSWLLVVARTGSARASNLITAVCTRPWPCVKTALRPS